jgi:UDP-2,3-diacylglucosamine pyrophosphatase LpxH
MPKAKIFTSAHPDVKAAWTIYNKTGSKREVAKQLEISDSKVYRLLSVDEDPSPIELPTFPDDDIPAEEILDSLEKRFDQKLKRENAIKWFQVKVNDPKPTGWVFVGDPHLGSNCHVSLLREDVKIMTETEGIHCICLGDTVDGWGGYLTRLYAEEDVSRNTEQRLAKWFLQDAGIPWRVFLIGNHDTMGDFSTYLKAINADKIPMIDWQAKFRLAFQNGSEVKINAAHNHKGTSIYNPLHGQKRAALWEENADIYVAGHHHNWAIQQEELSDGRVVILARSRGYKWLDTFATRHQFPSLQYGASIIFVVDPAEEVPTRRIKAFADLKEGAEYLTWLRKK